MESESGILSKRNKEINIFFFNNPQKINIQKFKMYTSYVLPGPIFVILDKWNLKFTLQEPETSI